MNANRKPQSITPKNTGRSIHSLANRIYEEKCPRANSLCGNNSKEFDHGGAYVRSGVRE